MAGRRPSFRDGFVGEYRAYRASVLDALVAGHPGVARERLVRLAQRIVDRCLVLLFCEGMGVSQGLGALLERAGDPDGSDVWDELRRRFAAVHGEDPGLDLVLVNRSFCGPGERTLRHFASRYEFGAQAVGARGVGLDALGRWFERSSFELDGTAEGVSRRKEGGVYYTPAWVTELVVEHTLGPRIAALRAEVGLDEGVDLARLERYERALTGLTIVDPACGAGAFLAEVLRQLVRARVWIAEARARITGRAVDVSGLGREVLAANLHGVDISAEAVALARVALWLEAGGGGSCAALGVNIRCGDSLVAFDWKAAFPAVFAGGGFDCVVGNPPYVKFQNLRRIDGAAAESLVRARRDDGAPLYASTQAGNFDLCMPFIEKGLALLRADGVMGYIAPSVWTVSASGAGLRAVVGGSRRLDRWIDLQDGQVFADATTYTALQFFRGRSAEEIRCGRLDAARRVVETAIIKYAELTEDVWRFLPAGEAALLRRLAREHDPLGEIGDIVVGLQTSADHIYQLRRVGPGRYVSFAEGRDGEAVEIEDAVMRPLVSGPEARRYASPVTTRALLFPYDDAGEVRLIAADELRRRYPRAWAYLGRHERALRGREKGAFDDDAWYRFGRSQNLDKQRLRKLGVAETVPSLRVFYDVDGAFCFNNVRVNGIVVDDEETGWFLLGVLNGPVADFVFRRGAKRKAGGYFEANRQFIAPLPVPRATAGQRAEIAAMARRLRALHDAGGDVADAEAAMNVALAGLYGLSEAERVLLAEDLRR